LSIDKKIDDGKVKTGNEFGATYWCKNENGVGESTNNCFDGSGNYLINNKTKECYTNYKLINN